MPYKDPARQRAYQREYASRRRAQWLAENGPCVNCGSWIRLEVDHIDPALKVSHSIWFWAAPRRLAELAKCQVLCCECHKAKTRAQVWREPPHGTRARYARKRDPCRCPECRTASCEYERERRALAKLARATA